MSLETKDTRKVVSLAFARIAKAVKECDGKELKTIHEAVEELERHLMLVKLVLSETKKKAPKRKPVRGKKRKAETVLSIDGEPSKKLG